jgi:hypothetical protein
MDCHLFHSRLGQNIFLSSKTSVRALVLPRHLVNKYRWLFPLGQKWQGREANHSPPSSAEVQNVWSYNSTPPLCLHGVVRNLAILIIMYCALVLKKHR